MVAFAGRARFTGVNSGVGERTGDGVRVEHPDTKGAGELRGRDPSRAELPGLPPRGRRSPCRKRSFATHVARLRPRLEDRRLPVAGPAARRPAGGRRRRRRSTSHDFASSPGWRWTSRRASGRARIQYSGILRRPLTGVGQPVPADGDVRGHDTFAAPSRRHSRIRGGSWRRSSRAGRAAHGLFDARAVHDVSLN